MNNSHINKYRRYDYEVTEMFTEQAFNYKQLEQAIINTQVKTEKTENKKNSIINKTLSVLLSLIIAPILTAIVADKLIRKSLEDISRESTLNTQTSTLENLYIGFSKEWLDNKIGVPKYIYEYHSDEPLFYTKLYGEPQFDILGCIYVTDIAITQVFYDKEDYSCKAFFITKMDRNVNIELHPNYSPKNKWKKSLGYLSYSDIEDVPIAYGGYFTNGIGRIFYAEIYPNQYSYDSVFATFNYGIKTRIGFSFGEGKDFYNKNSKKMGAQSLDDRSRCYPNTYGISSLSAEQTWNIIADIHSFDDNHLRFIETN